MNACMEPSTEMMVAYILMCTLDGDTKQQHWSGMDQIKQNFNQTQHSLRLVQASLATHSLPQVPSLPSVLCGPLFLVLLSDPEGLEPLASQADLSPPAYNEQYKHQPAPQSNQSAEQHQQARVGVLLRLTQQGFIWRGRGYLPKSKVPCR